MFAKIVKLARWATQPGDSDIFHVSDITSDQWKTWSSFRDLQCRRCTLWLGGLGKPEPFDQKTWTSKQYDAVSNQPLWLFFFSDVQKNWGYEQHVQYTLRNSSSLWSERSAGRFGYDMGVTCARVDHLPMLGMVIPTFNRNPYNGYINPYYPIPSMYGIFAYIWWMFMVNVGRYTIHGWYGYWIDDHPLSHMGLTWEWRGCRHGSSRAAKPGSWVGRVTTGEVDPSVALKELGLSGNSLVVYLIVRVIY